MANEIHVVPNGDEWEVTRPATLTRSPASTRRRRRPTVVGEQARSDQVEFHLHAGDGTVREKDSYGSDPRDIPG